MKKADSDLIKEAVQGRIEKEKHLAKKKQGKSSEADAGHQSGSKSKLVNDCLHAAELGDGVLFAELHKDAFVFNKSSVEWLKWSGHYWEVDLMDDALSCVENVAQEYGIKASELTAKIDWAVKKNDTETAGRLQGLQRIYQKRISKLRTERGRQNCLKFAHTNPTNALRVLGDQIDQEPWLLPCKNGVIDLKTGEMRPGRPENYLMRASPIEWHGIDEPAPTWDQALGAIFEDEEMISYLQRLLGYSTSGLTIEPLLPIMFGHGRNGKTTIVETIGHVLGPLAGPIQSEMLLDQGRYSNPSAPSPDIVDLRGLRIAFASEIEENRRFSASRVKWLSGSDTLVGRAPHDKRNTRFRPSHSLILMTNHKPAAPMDDFAFWSRVHLIFFPFSFVDRSPKADHERPADKHLSEKLKVEAPGILAWLVRGCLQWQVQGIRPPQKVKAATEEYRRTEDLLADFLEECCVLDPQARESAAAIFDKFKEWWADNVSKKLLSQKRFGQLLGKRFEKKKRNIYYYFGLRLLKP